jgi:hypothetical protein
MLRQSGASSRVRPPYFSSIAVSNQAVLAIEESVVESGPAREKSGAECFLLAARCESLGSGSKGLEPELRAGCPQTSLEGVGRRTEEVVGELLLEISASSILEKGLGSCDLGRAARDVEADLLVAIGVSARLTDPLSERSQELVERRPGSAEGVGLKRVHRSQSRWALRRRARGARASR